MNSKQRLLALCLGMAALQLSSAAQAGVTDISSTPLVVASPNAVQPNLMFVLDDSGSMGFDFMPDHVNGDGSSNPQLCRSSGALPANSGEFTNTCCHNGDSGEACWRDAPPFGSRRGHPPFLSASFNSMAYNPAIRYTPPMGANGVSWASMTSANTSGWTSVANDGFGIQNSYNINLLTQFPDTEWCTDTSYSDCLRNGNYVLPGTVNNKSYTVFNATTASGNGYKATGAPDNAGTTAQTWGPHYYLINAAEYCDNINLRNCQSTASAVFKYPAPVRWCNSDANARAATPDSGSCQAVRSNIYSEARYPTKYFTAGTNGIPATPEVRASTSLTISSISDNRGYGCFVSITSLRSGTTQLLSAATSSESNRGNLAASLTARINAGSSGFYASQTNRTVTITAPAGVAAPGALSWSKTPSTCNLIINPSTPTFSGYQAAVDGTAGVPGGYPGSFERVDIVSGRTSYPKLSNSRSDCAGATSCSYAEEMTNFANWWTYYRTRMQMMKSSTSQAFSAVSSNFRVGYLSINNSQGNAYLNQATFSGTAKSDWYSRLFNAYPYHSTPLRRALNTVGRLYAGKQTGSLNGTTVVDPIQYSCQRNYTVLSTDGFWNESVSLTQLDGTALGDQDGSLSRPQKDGNAVSNTLADVASYYYKTDLRTGTDGSSECTSGSGTNADVCGNGTVSALQRMVTFTLGLGASGYMQYQPDYLRATSGDYFSVAQGSSPNAAGGVCTWQSSGECTWPTPVSNTLTTIDDLWHAAVNGGGTYFSASNPQSLYSGLQSALNNIAAQEGASAAATASNPNVTSGDNQVFVSNFMSGEWTGQLKSKRIDLSGGSLSSTDWSAGTLLDSNSSRSIYMYSASNDNRRAEFNWSNLSASQKAYFNLATLTASGNNLIQFCTSGDYCLSASDQSTAAGQRLVDYLRGVRSDEGPLSDPSKFFRQRTLLLGDIVNSEAVYVKKPLANYNDAGFNDHKATTATRVGMVYVGANDGMLHAFNASSGAEVWAYVPTAVIPRLHKLADKSYGNKHEYYVDGSPVVQEVKIGSEWRTVLVSGLGAGGRAYFAIDITSPTDPKPLWEFTHDNLGYTFGKAEISKLADGTWVAILPSGYNNISPGDGNGRLFVLDIATGQPVSTLPNGIPTLVSGLAVGSSSTPSGLGHISAWTDNSDKDNTALRIYGGDNLGNLWRFDINNNVGTAGYEAQRLATLKTSLGVAQPITSRPELGQVGSHVMVYLGTGRYLGVSDLSDATQQTIYAIKDRLSDADFGNPRLQTNNFVQQTLSNGTCPDGSTICTPGTPIRTNGNPVAVDLNDKNGWYVDLPGTRERVTTGAVLVGGVLGVTSNVINSSGICSVGGSSWINYFDYRTGGPVNSAQNIVSISLGNALATTPETIQLPNNKVIDLIQKTDGSMANQERPQGTSNTNTRRLSWRELSD
ncbi:pilus assembly protein [Paucibacter sp. B51]|uniref:pilus assembly protein n=1 Tax=Paucibacter sp. B51 TaxID=2993315 RepID=UPI0022EBAB53|nr:PilC/PilY family type IV pilus protein [Paucibacter sp. B51]